MTKAYRAYCDGCAKEKRVCPGCCQLSIPSEMKTLDSTASMDIDVNAVDSMGDGKDSSEARRTVDVVDDDIDDDENREQVLGIDDNDDDDDDDDKMVYSRLLMMIDIVNNV